MARPFGRSERGPRLMIATPIVIAVLAALAAPATWWLVGAALLLLSLAAVAAYLAYRRHRNIRQDVDDTDTRPLPPIIFPVRAPGQSQSPPASPTVSEPRPDAARPTPPATVFPRAPIRFSLVTEPPSSTAPEPPPATDPAPRAEPLPPGDPVTAGRVRFHRPPDGTLQLLPGRLEILEADAAIHEIRFVKPADRDPAVTFGRTTGEPLAHVQLDAPTVSRLHARMHFLNGVWHIVNLSHTNPVVLNGLRLNGNAAPEGAPLNDGDLIEMGALAFRFRMP